MGLIIVCNEVENLNFMSGILLSKYFVQPAAFLVLLLVLGFCFFDLYFLRNFNICSWSI